MSKIEEINGNGEKPDLLDKRERKDLRLLLDSLYQGKLSFEVDDNMVKYWLDMLSWGEDCCQYGVCKSHKMITGTKEGGYEFVDKKYKALAKDANSQVNYPFTLVCRNKLKDYERVKKTDLSQWSSEDADIYLTGQFLFGNKKEEYEKICWCLNNNWN